MISKEASLATRLSWVATDVNQLIDAAEQALQDYLRDDESKAALLDANEKLQQVRNVMEIVGAHGVIMLMREISLLLMAIYAGNVTKLPQAREVMANANVRLRDYLQHLQDGYTDLPVVILPLLNDLRAARDAELLSEHLVFLPEESDIEREDMGVSDFVALDPKPFKEACVKLRYHFQKSLVAWYSGHQEIQSLQTLQRVSKNLIRINEQTSLRALWWVTMALAQALELKKLESSVAVKLLMGRLEREIRLFAEQGEANYAEQLPHELIKNLLYYIGLAEGGTQTLDAVKSAYHLDLHLPQGETLEQLRSYYQSPGRKLWESVSASLNQDIVVVTRLLETLEGRQGQVIITPTDLLKQQHELLEHLQKMSGTLGLIGLNRVADILQKMSNELQVCIDNKENLSRDQHVVYAEHLLKLKEVLAEYAETGHDISDAVFSARGQFTTSAIRKTYAAMLEMIEATQTYVTDFFKNENAFFQLEHAITALHKVNGAAQLLKLEEMQPLLAGALAYLQEVNVQKQQLSTTQQDYLADLLTIIEAALETLQKRESDASLLLRGYATLEALQQDSETMLLDQESLARVERILHQKKKKQLKLSPMMMKRLQDIQAQH
jgi:hypothetical protein